MNHNLFLLLFLLILFLLILILILLLRNLASGKLLLPYSQTNEFQRLLSDRIHKPILTVKNIIVLTRFVREPLQDCSSSITSFIGWYSNLDFPRLRAWKSKGWSISCDFDVSFLYKVLHGRGEMLLLWIELLVIFLS